MENRTPTRPMNYLRPSPLFPCPNYHYVNELWSHMGLNHEPLDYESIALTNYAMGPKFVGTVGIEPTCDRLPFLRLIRLRGYIPIYLVRPERLERSLLAERAPKARGSTYSPKDTSFSSFYTTMSMNAIYKLYIIYLKKFIYLLVNKR